MSTEDINNVEEAGFQVVDLDQYVSDIDEWDYAADEDSLIGRVMNKDYASLKDDFEQIAAKKIVSKIDSEKENIQTILSKQ